MDPLLLFGIGLGTGLSGAMIPGPLFLYTVSEAFRHGQWVGIQIALGHLLLEAVFVALVVLGLREFLSAPAFQAAVVAVGGIGLIVMGGLILAKVRRLSLARRADVAFRWGPWAGGAFFSVASPGFLIWWATIGASVFLQGALSGLGGVTMVWAGHAVADLAWCWFVAFSVEQGRAYCSDRTYRLIMGLIALWLLGLGVWLPLERLLACVR
jgi:threonine/homoserine/homoserine lactone efflux protein